MNRSLRGTCAWAWVSNAGRMARPTRASGRTDVIDSTKKALALFLGPPPVMGAADVVNARSLEEKTKTKQQTTTSASQAPRIPKLIQAFAEITSPGSTTSTTARASSLEAMRRRRVRQVRGGNPTETRGLRRHKLLFQLCLGGNPPRPQLKSSTERVCLAWPMATRRGIKGTLPRSRADTKGFGWPWALETTCKLF